MKEILESNHDNQEASKLILNRYTCAEVSSATYEFICNHSSLEK